MRSTKHPPSGDSLPDIFKQYYAPLVLFAFKITGDQGAAEDIVTDSFIGLWGRSQDLGPVQSVKSYLYTTARNRSLTWIKRQNREKKRIQTAALLEDDFQQSAQESMIYAETMRGIYNAMDRLPRQCRKVFFKYYIEGKKVPEIAAELNISVSSVRTHRNRGIELLQKALLTGLIWVVGMLEGL
jgi:RNA polymerase sigma-70 factor (ECF subfamily)